MSPDGLALVEKMLQVDPKKRPTMTEVKNHPWMMDDEVIEKVNKLIISNSAVNSSFSSGDDDRLPKRRRIGS